jgi:hypothetical protein
MQKYGCIALAAGTPIESYYVHGYFKNKFALIVFDLLVGERIDIIPDIAVAIYCGLQTLAATLASRFCSST